MSVSQEFDTSSSSCESGITLDAWVDRHSVAFNKARWSDEQFHGFMDAQVYPNFLRSEAIVQMLETRLLKADYGRVGMCFFNGWRNYDLRDKQFEDDDRYELQTWLMHLACSWMSSLSKRKTKESSHACKNGVESIIELAFQLRVGADQVWRRDAELALPDEPSAVIADSVAFMSLPGIWRDRFEDVRAAYPFSWSYSNRPESVITFVFMASEKDSNYASTRDRLQMCFYSAQKHRRALCCEDAPIFGMTLHNGLMEYYVSSWERHVLSVRPIFRRYVLEFFSDFAECYFVLCRIAEYTSEFLQRQFVQWNETHDFKEKMRQASRRPWRNKARDDLGANLCVPDELGNTITAKTGVDASCLNRIRDRKARIFVESVRQSRYSTETGYPMTRKNKKAFDIVTGAKEAEQVHALRSPSAWAEETYLYRDKYEDPAPFSPSDSEEQAICEDSRMDAQPGVDSDNKKLTLGRTCHGANSLPQATRNAETRDSRRVFILQSSGLGMSSTSPTNQLSLKNSVALLDCTSIKVC